MDKQGSLSSANKGKNQPEMDISTNAVLSLYPNGSPEWVNEGFEQIYEYTFKDYLKRFGHDIFSPASNGFQMALEKFDKGEKGLTFEHQIETPSGNSKWIQTTLTPFFTQKGKLEKIIAVETDITEPYLEKKKTEELLANILPFEISEQLKKKGTARAKKYKRATVMFADFKNFTTLTKSMKVDELITELNYYVREFDEIIEKHYLEKIKTMGDAYMCAGGLPLKNYSNPFDVALASLEIQKFVREFNEHKMTRGKQPWKLRIGIHTGEVMAGVIGSKKFAYDIWGNTVNIASRMEHNSEVEKINVSGATYNHLRDYFEFTFRGNLQMKNVEEDIDMYFINRIKPEYSQDGQGIYPNARFREILAQY